MAKIVIVENANFLENKDFDRLLELVSDKRKEKVNRYRKDEDKSRALIAGVLVRMLICKECGISNKKLNFEIEEKGKLVCTNDECNLQFNLSHSGKYVICGIDTEKIGVDVEKINKYDSKIAERFFCKSENDLIVNSDEKEKTFFKLWTLKEAYIKYLGEGMYKELNSFKIEFVDNIISNIYENNEKQELYINSYNLNNEYFWSSVSKSKIEKIGKMDLQSFIKQALKILI